MKLRTVFSSRSKLLGAAALPSHRGRPVLLAARSCPDAAFLRGALRWKVSLAAILERADTVLPCYAIVKQQLQPQASEQECVQGDGWAHAISWTIGDRPALRAEGAGRSKREARNVAARKLLCELALLDANQPLAHRMDPASNGALAQWAIEWLNQALEASIEFEEVREGSNKSLTCKWSCPKLDADIEAHGSASRAAESRRQAMAALYGRLPDRLNAIIADIQPTAAASPAPPARDGTSAARAGEVIRRHTTVVQKLAVNAEEQFEKIDLEFKCTLRWSFWDPQLMQHVSSVAEGSGRSKAIAKSGACEDMLVRHGHMPRLSEAFHVSNSELQRSLAEGKVTEAVAVATRLMEDGDVDVAAWPMFLPDVFRASLVEDDDTSHTLLSVALRELDERGGASVELWERLLDEASLSLRHYAKSSSVLEQLRHFRLANDAFPGEAEREYFVRFRHLLALERHGGMLSGINEYELDPEATCSVPVVDVHKMDGDLVVLTSTPESRVVEIVEGSRALRTSDVVLLVPLETASSTDASFGDDGMGKSTNWQHPEAWLGSVTSVKGDPRDGEEVLVGTRRLSRFSSSVERYGDGSASALAPISLGRQYQLFRIAMETPLSRQLAALRCLCSVQLPAWSTNFEGRRPSYQYSQALRNRLLNLEDAVEVLASTPANADNVQETLSYLASNSSWYPMLTPSQQSALQNALDHRLSLIQGPPGTGKTYVACAIIAAWIDFYARRGMRILAVADSNVAADNIQSRLSFFGIDSVRVGQGREGFEAVAGSQLRRAVMSAQVVVATCIGSGMPILDGKDASSHFQCVIVDECTQACEPAALVALGRCAENVVLVGDHKQLPATVLSKLAQRSGLGVSLFERMVDACGFEPTLLQEQRRMHSSISEFPNRTFYNSQLINAVSDDDLAPVPGFPWPVPDCRVCFVDVAATDSYEEKRGFSAFNAFEARAVADVLSDLLRAGVAPGEIGVLTAYLAQKREILRAIRAKGLEHVLNEVTVDTVDGYQGMERDIILFSATRSNSRGVLGFLADARRMNVMLTRAKRGLLVFGHADTLRNAEAVDSHWGAWLEWVESRGSTVSLAALRGDAASAAFPAAAAHRDGPPAPPAAPKADWTKVYSEEYGAHYFWNKATGETQWDAPLGF
eukprot:TRINITY_DN14189_c1_g1_i2.p1 TRINITY_DN14189_c1_g1~~TRINITY_DN14189_c1_g1_i2.p1  ORF type:complete len:1146 (-),score=207.53 TRINITY_DN14189_c1_g1_i2:63-3500(-)